jgi:hypothetical protein
MAINVDTVYKTVLLILNKEQRGYITPDEFNKTATQVQLDIFENYFEDINQQLRVPQSDYDYSSRQTAVDDKIAIFKEEGACTYNSGKFILPTQTLSGVAVVYNTSIPPVNYFEFYKLGTVVYSKSGTFPVRLQRLQKSEFYEINKSDLTAPSENFPVYLYEGQNNVNANYLTVSPSSITSDISANFIRKPKNVIWAYTTGSFGQYVYNSSGSVNFELHPSEQVEVITRILLYSGVIVKDPQIVQVAASEIQQNEINKKS